jgi:hypothetical protein
MEIPAREEAESLLAEGERRNPGPWVDHSRHVALAAEAIARHTPLIDEEEAYILGLLHDIGRQEGPTNMRHVLDGFLYMDSLGFTDSARICLTHSFVIQHVHAHAGRWDCTAKELQFLAQALTGITYTDIDCLIQLCDALALPSGFCLIEKRLVDVALRHGTNEYTLPRWQAIFELQAYFDALTGRSIYSVLPGVVQNTFGFAV